MGPDQYLFINPVWGEAYVERFVKVSLPSQITSGNLGAMPEGKGLYLIYTLAEHVQTIRRSPAYRRLREMVRVSIRSLDDLPHPRLSKNPHELQTAAYMRGIRAGEGTNAAFVFLTPDILLSDGTFRSMVQLAEAGKRIHLVAGIRMLTEGAVSCIVQHRVDNNVGVPIPGRGLVRFCLDNLHPISRAHIANSGRVHAAQHLYHLIGDHGLLARGYHLHPLLVWPRITDAVIHNTLDDEYVSRACPDRNDWHTVTDSDEMCVIEFSDAHHKSGMIDEKPLDESRLYRFLSTCTTPDHREHVQSRILFHTQGTHHPDWAIAAAASDALVQSYQDLLDRGVPEPKKPVIEEQAAAPAPILPPVRRPLAKRLMQPFASPLKAAYRLAFMRVNQRVNSLQMQILHQQKQLDQILHQLTIVSKLYEAMQSQVGKVEEEAKRALIHAALLETRTRAKNKRRDAA